MFFSCSNNNLEEIKDLIKEGEVPTEKFENISKIFEKKHEQIHLTTDFYGAFNRKCRR